MKKNILLASTLVLSVFAASGQCSFSGLNSNYCDGDGSSTLVPSGSGTFSGPGVTGNTFDPVAAGLGTHIITYAEGDPNTYTIDQGGTFAPVAGSGTSVLLSDDQVSGALPIGFSFTFFGNAYTDFYISSNGFMTFSNNGNDGCCSGDFLPNGTTPDNLIAFGWSDMYPPGNGSISYFTTGTAPNRMLVMNFTDIPFCCDNIQQISTQVVLYETSNIVEIHTTYANAYFSGTQGIENVGGTIAFPVPGRNAADWVGFTSDYVAFIPSLCSEAQITTVSTSPVISLSANDEVSGNDGSVNLTILSGSAPFTFDWDNDGTGDNDDSNDLFGVPSGTYTVVMTDGSGCSTTETITVGGPTGLDEIAGAEFSISPNPSTGIFNINISDFEANNKLHLLIVNTLGQRVMSGEITADKVEVNMSTSPAGVYFVKIVSESGTAVKQIIIK